MKALIGLLLFAICLSLGLYNAGLSALSAILLTIAAVLAVLLICNEIAQKRAPGPTP